MTSAPVIPLRGGPRAPCAETIGETPSSCDEKKDKPMSSRISARKEAKRIKDIAPRIAIWALWTAFPSRSVNQCAETAASVCGGHPDTYRRILTGEVRRISWPEVAPVLVMATAKRGIDLFELVGTPNVGAQGDVDQAPVAGRAGAPEAGAGAEAEGKGDRTGRDGGTLREGGQLGEGRGDKAA